MPTPRLLASIAVIVAAQVAWLAWIFAQPLPNAANVGGRSLNRLVFLANALPEVVPGVRFEQSHLGLALKELAHVENLPQRGPIALGAAFIAVAAIAAGNLVLRGLRLKFEGWERSALAFGLGTIALGLLTLGFGRLGWLSPWGVRAGLALVIVAEVGCRCAAGDGVRVSGLGWSVLGIALVVGPFLFIMALGAMLPTVDFDALEYHLQGPKEYFQNQRITFLPHNVYTSMPFGVEMLHLLGMHVMGDWWRGALVGQLLVMLHAPATAALVAATARLWGSPRAGWVAAVVYLTSPWVYRLAVIPYVEGPLCFFHAALVWSIGQRPTATRHWFLVGLLAGGAMACKYPALISAVIPFGIAAIVAGRRSGLAYALGVIVVIGPWLAKNVNDTGNPVYPLAYGIFGGRHWDEASDLKWSAAHGRRPISTDALTDGLLDIAGRSDWQSPLFTALAPLALLRRDSRRLALVGYLIYLFATWWLLTHRLDRFWLPMLPALAVLAGLGADWTRNAIWTAWLGILLAVVVLTNLSYTSTALAGFNEWTLDLDVSRRRVPELLNPALAKVDLELPPDATLMLVGQASVFHLQHPIVYNTVFDEERIELAARGRSAEEVGRELARLGVTHIFVDWHEIERHRKPGGYGFTPFVTPELFEDLTRAGVLQKRPPPGSGRELYEVARR